MKFLKKLLMLFFIIFSSNLIFSNEYYIKLDPVVSNFYLVLDKSGSMSGTPMENTIQGALTFVDNIKSTDNVGIITFGSSVKELSKLTNNKNKLSRIIRSINSSGSTLLYDGIATAIRNISYSSGNKIIVFLTDGSDSGSVFSINDLDQMNKAENIFVYGIGLGAVNHSGIRGIAEATEGSYSEVVDDTELNNIYTMVLDEYYRYNDSNLIGKGQITVKSLPYGTPVFINDEFMGNTPVSLRGVEPEDYNIKVKYKKGTWERDVKVMENYLTVVETSESEVPGNLTIGSKPGSASVFIDGTYVGMTGLIGNAVADDTALKVNALPPGKHKIKIIVAPDTQFSASQVWEFDFNMGMESRHVLVNVFFNTAQFTDGEVIKRDPMINVQSAIGSLGNSGNFPKTGLMPSFPTNSGD